LDADEGQICAPIDNQMKVGADGQKRLRLIAKED
jgi:hypothetical protein